MAVVMATVSDRQGTAQRERGADVSEPLKIKSHFYLQDGGGDRAGDHCGAGQVRWTHRPKFVIYCWSLTSASSRSSGFTNLGHAVEHQVIRLASSRRASFF